jgi:hypothetical protein
MLWWIPLVIAAAGQAAKMKQDRDVRKQQSALTDEMTRSNAERAKKSTAAINQFLDESAPQARATETQALREELTGRLNEGVDAVRKFEEPETFSGRVSDDYNRVRSVGRARTEQRVNDAISQLATIGLPGQRSVNESLRYGRAGSVVDAENSAMNNMSGAYRNAIEGVHTDPFNRMAADLTTAAGMAMTGMKGMNATVTPTASGKPSRLPPPKGKIYSG